MTTTATIDPREFTDEKGRLRFPRHLLAPPEDGETWKEARLRRSTNKQIERAYFAFIDERCGRCGQVRHHVNHEPDPTTSIEGPDYYADFLDELHPFEPPR